MGSSVLNSETLTFRDGTEQWNTSTNSISDSTRYMTPHGDVDLQNFFSRPILTHTYTWTPGITPFYQTFNPWVDFFTNKRVVNRMTNFNILNAKLKVKIVVNGNPFYYGRLLADYVPLKTYDAVTDVTGLSTLACTGASQRLHLYIDPATSQAGTLELPFVYPENGVAISSGLYSLLGQMYIRELVSLKHANGAATAITINTFVWAEDVVLSIPTTVNCTDLVPQSSEVDMRPSTIASSVAAAAGNLTSIPYIGRYALATQLASTTLSKVAKFFGYSRPCIVDEPRPMRPTYIGELACVDKKENVVKLTADSRQELTIDSSVVGITVPDELAINYIAGKESYFTTFPWAIASAEGTHLFNTRVSPSTYTVSGGVYYMTAPCFAALPFKYWRGTMKYRFQIVASAYHKGRLLFVYDPNYITGLETNVVYSRIVDLENERDFVIDVAWSQPNAFLAVTGLSATVNYSTTAYAASNANYNGVLGVYVLNSLTSPNSVVNNDISINVFISACDDIEFAEPNANNIKTLALSTQSDLVEMDVSGAPTAPDSVECMSECVKQDESTKVFFGEAFKSFRALLKRYNYHSTYTSGAPAAAGRYTWVITQPDFPVPRGVVTSGGMNNAGLANYTTTTLLHYLAPAFCCQRGGIRYKKILHEDTFPTSSTFSVLRGLPSAYGNGLTLRADTTVDAYMKQGADYLYPSYGFNAAASTVSQQQPVLEIELPYYRHFRFSTSKDPAGKVSPYAPILGSGHANTVDTKFSATTDRTTFDQYVGVAEDFQLIWFQGAPPMKVYTIP